MRRWSYALVIGAAALGGCTKADDTTTTPRADTALIDIDQARPGSPERTVLRLLRYLQLKTPMVALDAYHRRVAESLGRDAVVESLAAQHASVQGAQIRTLISERTDEGALVSLEVHPKGQDPTRYSFVLRRRNGRWVIVYDNVLEDGLSFVAQSRAKASAERRTGKTPPATVGQGAARRAVQRYRSLFLRTPSRRRRPETSARTPAAGGPPEPQASPGGGVP